MKNKGRAIMKFCIGLTLVAGINANANWGGSSGMMPFAGQNYMQPQAQPFGGGMPWGAQSYTQPQMQPFGGGMPWGAQRYSQPRYAQPQSPFGAMSPWGMNSASAYQAPQAQPFGMMPFGGMTQQQPQPQQQTSFMMPGMDQGIRSMMEPGKIMAEEATPGVYMKPTWR